MKFIIIVLFRTDIFFIIFGGWFIYKTLQFHIVREQPSLGNISAISPSLDIEFNRNLSSKVNITSTPKIIKNISVRNKTIIINFNIPMLTNHVYTIDIVNVSTTKGSHLYGQKLQFIPKHVTGSSFTNAYRQKLLKKQTQYEQAISDYPLLKLLPFTGPNFEYSIDYNMENSSQGEIPVIQITTLSQQGRQDALNWIIGQGYNPSQMKIQYIDAQP